MMKKIIFAIVAISAITIMSCNSSKPVDYVLFSGTIKNPKRDILTILNNTYKSVRKIKVSDTGVFADTIFNANGYYRFSDGKGISQMFLKDGYNIHLEVDANEFNETIAYTGNGGDINNYLAQKFLNVTKTDPFKKVYSLDETAYLSVMNQEKSALETALVGLDPEFVKQEKLTVKYDYIYNVLQYQTRHIFFTKNEDFKVSEAFPDVLKGLELNNEAHFKTFSSYRSIVLFCFNKAAEEKAKKENTSFATAFKNLIKASKSEIINQDAIASLSSKVTPDNPEAEESYNVIMEYSTDEAFKKRLTKQFNDNKKFAKGAVSPVFVNYENHAGGTTSLTDLKGKYVYIDVWATWCGPCKKEIPFLKEVEKAYHDKNIKFVSVSVDKVKDREKWKNMIVDKELGGIQLLADKDKKSDFFKEYDIKGIPRFILIDPDGNIVSADAPRPSDRKLIALFNTLKI